MLFLANNVDTVVVLTELPLPSPIEPSGKKKSLLFNPRVADEARRVLAAADPNIVSQMAHVLQQTNVDHMYVCMVMYQLCAYCVTVYLCIYIYR